MTAKRRDWIGAAGAAAMVALSGVPASSHPHVWVATKSHAVFENGALTGLRYTWLFDELYTTNALDGLDTNNDGKVEGAELDELTKVNIEGLKEFEYFTSVTLGGKPLQFADPKQFSMEVLELDEAPGPQMVAGPASDPAPPVQERPGLWQRFTGWLGGLVGRSDRPSAPVAEASKPKTPEKSKVLALHMTLPLKSAIPSTDLKNEKSGFQFLVSDAQMFIWFEPAAKDGYGVAPGAPEGCRAAMVDQEMTEEQKKLQEAFGRVGGLAVGGAPKAIGIICAKP